MSVPVLPTFPQGPAAVIRDGYTWYSQAGIQSILRRETTNPDSDIGGKLGERHKSARQIISFTPVGEIESLAKSFPLGVSDIGKSIFTASDVPVVIHTYADGITHTFGRSGVSKMPSLFLSPNKTFMDAMEITCIGKRATLPTNATFWKAVASAAFTDASFDETKVKTDIYTAAYGSSPFNAMGAIEGFKFEITQDNKDVMDDNVGVYDIILKSLAAMVTFRPNNLSEANIDTLLGMDDSTVKLPGQNLASAATDLVITSDSLVATLYKAGAKEFTAQYETGEGRPRDLVFVSKRTWTTGVGNPLWDFTIP